jgi:hypothetical protein
MKRFCHNFLLVLSPILLGTLLTAGIAQAAVSFLEDFEGLSCGSGDCGTLGDHLGWDGPGGGVGFGPGANLGTNVANAPGSNRITRKAIGGGAVDDLMTFKADLYTTGIYDTAGGEALVGVGDSSGYGNSFLAGPGANPANPGYPGAGGGGWFIHDGLNDTGRINITDGGAPGMGNRFFGGTNVATTLQMVFNQIDDTISVDILDRATQTSLNPTFVVPLTAGGKAELAAVSHVVLSWMDVHPGDLKEVDNIRINSGLVGTPNQWTWNNNKFGDWNRQEHWTADSIGGIGSLPVNAEHTAVFGDNVVSATLVGVSSPVTINRIEFDSDNTYVIAGANNVSVEVTSNAENPSVGVNRGDHQFQAEFILNNDTTIDISAGSSLTFNNILDLGGNGLAKTGAGTLVINNILSSGNGGTLLCQEGTCGGAGTIAGNVVNNNGTLSPGSSAGVLGGSTVVPEPAGMLLSLFSALAVTCCRYRPSV